MLLLSAIFPPKNNGVFIVDNTAVVAWQRAEELAVLVASSFGFPFFRRRGHLPWRRAALMFFAPHLGFLGDLLGPRAGAFCYNGLPI